ncbi:MAG: dTMP kinase [Pseudonocardia sp.]|nr:dTMP kinase [Pseudonocardia sp.]
MAAALIARGATVARFAFPRYGVDEHADLVREGLYGRLAAVNASVPAMALLYALDRRAAAPELEKALIERDIVLVDRFTASNAAYGAARLREDADGAFAAWVGDLESELGVPQPDRQLLLDVPRDVAGQRARARERRDPGRARDTYESDAGLQDRAGAVYRGLAAAGWRSPWTVVDGGSKPDAEALARRIWPGASGSPDGPDTPVMGC